MSFMSAVIYHCSPTCYYPDAILVLLSIEGEGLDGGRRAEIFHQRVNIVLG